MWDLLRTNTADGDHLLSAVRDLFQATSRNLIVALGALLLGSYLVLAATWPARYDWSLAAVALFTLGWTALAYQLVSKRIVAGQIVVLIGYAATVFLAQIVLRQPLIGFLFALLPLMAVTLLGILAALAGEILIGGLVFLLSQPGLNAMSAEIAVGVLLVSAFVGIIGWVFAQALLTILEYLLYSYEEAHIQLEDAREQRMILKQTEEDLLHANRELYRLTNRVAAMHEAAQAARRAKEEFVANVSHELRTPLNMIISFSDMITGSPQVYGRKLPPALLADMAVIQRNSLHLSRLVDDVLDLSQVEAGAMAISKEPSAVEDILESAVTAVRPLFDTKKLYLNVEIAGPLPMLNCDRTRVRQVIINLLSNAGRFTEQGGVHVRAWQDKDKDRLLISVADSGPGIAAEAQAELFQPFKQVDATLKRLHGGTGLGLNISKRFIEMHDGDIWLESTVGVGTTFTISLPLDVFAPSAESPSGAALRAAMLEGFIPRTRPYRVKAPHLKPRYVLLESGNTMQRLFRRYFAEAEIVGVPGMAEAYRELERAPFEALVVNAYSADGTESAALNARNLPFDTPVITCWIPQDDVARQLGVAQYLIKPVDAATLLSAVENAGPDVRNVLVIDDEPDVRRLFSRILSNAPQSYCVTNAEDGAHGLALARSLQPDVIVLDLIMPGLSGFDLLKEKQQDAAIRDIPVIIVSSRDPGNQPIVTDEIAVSRSSGLSVSDLIRCVQAITEVFAPARPQAAQAPG